MFAKFAGSDNSSDLVVYQVLSRSDGIIVDMHMQASRSIFHPYRAKHTATTFSSIYQNVIKRDKDCAKK